MSSTALLVLDRLADAAVADRQREQRMVGDQDARHVFGSMRAKVSRMKAICSSLILPSLKVSERAVLMPSTAAVGKLVKRAQVVVDVAAVAGQRRQEAAQHVVERDVVIARHAEHVMARVAQPLEEARTPPRTARSARAG